MKKFISLLLSLSLLIWGCKPTPTPEPQPQPQPQPQPEPEKVLVAPSNLHVEVLSGIEANLTWDNASNDYDGVALEKAAP